MLPEKIIASLSDIKTSIESIEDYLSEFIGDQRDFNAYMQKKHLRRSVERELEIIGEATRRITKVDPDFHLDNTRGIIGLRNLVSHAYDSINDTYIWAIIINHLPKLKEDVNRLLEQK